MGALNREIGLRGGAIVSITVPPTLQKWSFCGITFLLRLHTIEHHLEKVMPPNTCMICGAENLLVTGGI